MAGKPVFGSALKGSDITKVGGLGHCVSEIGKVDALIKLP